jgi:imidazolonepropionase-like amidohydrolase
MARTIRVRHAVSVLAVLLMALPAEAQSVVLVGGTVIDGTGRSTPDATVVVTADRITCVGTAAECPVPAGATRVDAAGRFITPGLVDAHVHYSQTGWVDGRPDGLPAPAIYPYADTARALRANPARWHRTYLCTGITAVFDVGGHPWTTRLPEQAERDPLAPHVRAAGPLITFAGPAALNVDDDELFTFLPMATPGDVQASVARLKAMGAQAVKVWYLSVPPERRAELDARMMEVGAAARAAGLDLIAHATGLREAKVALKAGAVLLVHSVEDQPIDDEFIALLSANRAVYAPTLLVGRNATRASVSVAVGQALPIDDPGRCVDPDTIAKTADVERLRPFLPPERRGLDVGFRRLEAAGARTATMAQNLRRVHASGNAVVVATDAGNPLTLHGPSIYWEMEAMQEAGIPAAEVVVMATRNGARVMHRADDFGTLETGRLADLLILAEDPRQDVRAFRTLTHVMRAGRLHRQSDLRQR